MAKNNKKSSRSKQVREEYPHFRHYLVSGHPALVVAEHSDKEYKYRKVMHNERDGRHLNEKVYPNPNKRDKEPMYIAKRVRHDKKNISVKNIRGNTENKKVRTSHGLSLNRPFNDA